MKWMLVLLVMIAGCGGSDHVIHMAYKEPVAVPYSDDTSIRQYTAAYRAGWESVVLAVEPQKISPHIIERIWQTCCEAVEPVTKGWYAGQDYGNAFIRDLCKTNADLAAKRAYLTELQGVVREHPATNWYVPDR